MVNAIARNLADSNLAPDIMSRDAVRTSVATDRVCRDPAPALSAFEQRLNSSNTHQVVRCYWSDGFGLARMALPVTHTRGAIECANTTSMRLASLYASKERKTPALKRHS
jgi:hypothetical protein